MISNFMLSPFLNPSKEPKSVQELPNKAVLPNSNLNVLAFFRDTNGLQLNALFALLS